MGRKGPTIGAGKGEMTGAEFLEDVGGERGVPEMAQEGVRGDEGSLLLSTEICWPSVKKTGQVTFVHLFCCSLIYWSIAGD